MSESHFSKLEPAPLDPIVEAIGRWENLRAVHDDPINATVGVLIDHETGKPWRPWVVGQARGVAAQSIDSYQNYGYQSQAGHGWYLEKMAGTVLGEELHENTRE